METDTDTDEDEQFANSPEPVHDSDEAVLDEDGNLVNDDIFGVVDTKDPDFLPPEAQLRLSAYIQECVLCISDQLALLTIHSSSIGYAV